MNHFTSAWIWTLFRSVLLVCLALPWCGLMVRWIRASQGWKRSLQWSLMSIPFLFPELLTGYAYSQMTRLLITDAWTREFWFDLLLFFRIVPVGTGLWYCSPPSPLSREAIHVRVLAIRPEVSSIRRIGILCWYQLQGPARMTLFAGAGLFLVIFQEFELASLLAVRSWTVWLFDAQVEGLPQWDSLKYVVLPALCTWLICGSLPWWVVGQHRESAELTSRPSPMSARVQASLWLYLVLACALIAIYPFCLMGLETAQGLSALVYNWVHLRGLMEGILIAGGLALIAAVVSDLAAEVLVAQFPPRGWKRIALVGVSCGLAGPLAIGLTLLSLFQQPGLISWRETTIPALCGLVVWLLPRAVVLQGIRRTLRSPIAEHAATLLSAAPDFQRQIAARRVQWLIRDRGQFAARVVLFHWAYWELTIPSLLNPAGLISAPVRLYIDAHFARNAILTAKACIMLLAPVLVLLSCWCLMRMIRAARQRQPRQTTSASHNLHRH
ncbi:MAG: hypothetical protein JWM11_4695 [Planctomycetaceae bacterium]|nr:hypothetical protein [Planctomycetaceae bacterium]